MAVQAFTTEERRHACASESGLHKDRAFGTTRGRIAGTRTQHRAWPDEAFRLPRALRTVMVDFNRLLLFAETRFVKHQFFNAPPLNLNLLPLFAVGSKLGC